MLWQLSSRNPSNIHAIAWREGGERERGGGREERGGEGGSEGGEREGGGREEEREGGRREWEGGERERGINVTRDTCTFTMYICNYGAVIMEL